MIAPGGERQRERRGAGRACLVCAALFLILRPGAAAGAASPAAVPFDPGGATSLRLLPLEERQRPPADVDVAVWPTGLIDAERTHHLSQSTLTIMILAFANPKARDLKRAWLVIELPSTVELLATNTYLRWNMLERSETERDGSPYRRYEFPCIVHPTTFPRGRGRGAWFHRYRPPAVWLMTDLPAGSRPGKAYSRVRYELKPAAGESPPPPDARSDAAAAAGPAGQRDAVALESPERWVHLAVLPRIQAQQPKLARSGIMGRFIANCDRLQPQAPMLITSLIKQLGFNYYIAYVPLPPEQTDLQRWGESFVHNGFDVRLGTPPPPEIRYVSARKEFPRAVSPWAIYRKHPWVVKTVFGRLREQIAQQRFSAYWSNWEPYAFLTDGDYSARSRDEFVAWSGLQADEVAKGWPLDTVKTYASQWRRFRNWELGQVARVLADEIAKAGKEAGLDTRLALGMSNDSIWATTDEHACSALEWGDMPYWLQTWNYYFTPNSEGPWPVSDRSGAPQVLRAAGLARWLDRQFGPARKVKLGCLYGWDQTGGGGYFLPEQLGFLHLSTVFGGMRNAQNYAEWTVWDGRYAREIALANTRIARWEDIILNGAKQRTHVAVPLAPYPQETPDSVKPEDQETGPWEQPGRLFTYEYHKDGKALVLAANAWNNGPCRFRLRFPDLSAGRQYRLSEPEANRVFTNSQGKATLSATDLKQGLTVGVGAMRWGAFLLEPAADRPVTPE